MTEHASGEMSGERKYLVTGASGFVGEVLCRRLRSGAFVRAMLRTHREGPWDEAVRSDLQSSASLEETVNTIDTVFHLAGKAHDLGRGARCEAEYRHVNVDGTRRLLDAAARAGVRRFVFVSSVKAMGEGGEPCLDEDVAPSPVTPYGRSKREAELLVLGERRIPHRCVLRSSLVYGRGVKGNIARMIRAVERGYFPPIREVRNARSMVHVEDLVSAILLAADRPEAAGEVFIVTDGRTYSTREMYDWIRLALGRRPLRWSVPVSALGAAARLGDGWGKFCGGRFVFDSAALAKLVGSEHYDSTRIRERLGFRPRHDLARTLPEIVSSLRTTR